MFKTKIARFVFWAVSAAFAVGLTITAVSALWGAVNGWAWLAVYGWAWLITQVL
jgi:hypothetical protein